MSTEKRTRHRIELKQTISVSGEKSLVLVEMLDLSMEGISFLSDISFNVDAIVYFIFPGAGGLQENEVEARIWRCEHSEDSSLPYKVAAVFVDANMTYLEDVAKLLNEEKLTRG